MVARVGDHFFLQIPGVPKFTMFPESKNKFFMKLMDVQITFDVDAEGKTTQATLQRGGRDQVAKLVSR